MYYRFESRLILQVSDTRKYYLPVVSATTDDVYPFSIPTAEIEVLANNGKVDYAANLIIDNIVRLQVTVRYSPFEKPVWYDLFEGRILTTNANFGTKQTVSLVCVGHIAESGYTLIEEAKTWATATDLKDILSYFSQLFSRTSVSIQNATGITSPYSTKSCQKYMKDLFMDAEKLTGYNWFFKAKGIYNSSNIITGVNITFNQFATVPTTLYKVIQGTPRLISARFDSDGQELYNNIIEFGNTPSGGTQYKGTAPDSTAIARYGKRTLTNTDTGFESNDICASFANKLLPKFKDPRASGTVVLMGTPKASIGDLVTVNIKNADIEGNPINRNMTVYKVHHEIGFDSFRTTLDLGKAQNSTEDYLAEFARKNRLNMANFIS